ncbi:MAG: hypothetical protein HYR56_00505 [Acidobacteria bacterium]|nr:hypothetical protein [Acidobacteriota bacterium]MBI3423743.1 hypothetical protein [Acidobacteriota bacterium]
MRRHLQFVFAACFCLLLLVGTASAQSGRKQKKADPLPPVQGVNQPETRTVAESTVAPEDGDKPKAEELKTRIQVMSDMGDIGIPSYFSDTARAACAHELKREVRGLQASDAGGNKNRKDAMDVAKNNDNVYVVLFELQVDRMGMSSNGLELRYTVFEPKTGKQVAFGMGMPVQPNGMPQPPIGATREQVQIEWAARDAAQQILSKLKLRGGY